MIDGEMVFSIASLGVAILGGCVALDANITSREANRNALRPHLASLASRAQRLYDQTVHDPSSIDSALCEELRILAKVHSPSLSTDIDGMTDEAGKIAAGNAAIMFTTNAIEESRKSDENLKRIEKFKSKYSSLVLRITNLA